MMTLCDWLMRAIIGCRVVVMRVIGIVGIARIMWEFSVLTGFCYFTLFLMLLLLSCRSNSPLCLFCLFLVQGNMIIVHCSGGMIIAILIII